MSNLNGVKLPKWMQHSLAIIRVDNDSEASRIEEALAIAWEALAEMQKADASVWAFQVKAKAEEALRRIDSLGDVRGSAASETSIGEKI